MDQTSAQTEKIATYETSRTRRSRVDGLIHSDDSNNDEEFAASGFYVREKTTEKKPDSTRNVNKENDNECRENGISEKVNTVKPVENDEVSEDGENSRGSKKSEQKLNDQAESEQSASEDDAQQEKTNSPKEPEDKKEKNEDNSEKTEKETNLPKEPNDEKEKNEDNCEKTNLPKEPEDEKENNKDNCEVLEAGSENNVESNKECDETKNDDSIISKIETNTDESKKHEETDTEKETIAQTNTEKIQDNEETVPEKEVIEEKEQNTDSTEENTEEQKQESLLPKTDDSSSDNQKKDNGDNEVKQDEETLQENDNVKKSESTKEIDKSTPDKDDGSDKDKSINEENKTEDNSSSILKDQLEKSAAEENMDMEMDEDFDPSLLCPDISMDVDEAPVITNENRSEDGGTSPLPYEATFSTLVDEITGAEVSVDLTPEEMELRQKMYGPNNLVQYTKIHCTACNVHLGSALTGANNRFVHPLLGVLICKNCYHFYTSGEFEKDEDGSELYCRWCGQGGQVLCCSSCEFVFCKRCIRNNFGPKKFKEIRDSDDWNCFRCDRGQLSNLRASCAEFMEYYRTELARAQSLSQTNPELMTTDYTKCCRPTEKKEEPKTPAPQKNPKRKKKDEEDPDYHPIVEEEEPPKKKILSAPTTGGPGYTIIPPSNLRPVLPKNSTGQTVRPMYSVVQQGPRPQQAGQLFKVGNTTFRARSPAPGQGYTIQRPQVSKSSSPGYITIPPSTAPKTTPGYITIPPSSAPKTTTPGYIKILPQKMQQNNRQAGSYTVVSGTSNGKPTFTTVATKKNPPTPPAMKHEWFEKTVRAAARVNSNLSYTLTQLNRQQSQANSVEALAMVHNKLQEVLSTSINSLIQIRKNLRTEFISGIKNIKFPPKPAPIPPTSGPIVVKDDDDVILVSSPPKTASPLPPPPPLVLSPSVTLTKRTPVQKSTDPFADPKPSTSGISNNTNNTPSSSIAPRKGGFLKVRSFTALQSVPSECITIPDDPPAPANKNIEMEEDPLKLPEDDKPKDESEEQKAPEISSQKDSPSAFDPSMTYNVNEEPSPVIKKMLNACVMLKKSRVIDEIIRAQGLLTEADNKAKETESKETVESEQEKDKNKQSDIKKDEKVKEKEMNGQEITTS